MVGIRVTENASVSLRDFTLRSTPKLTSMQLSSRFTFSYMLVKDCSQLPTMWVFLPRQLASSKARKGDTEVYNKSHSFGS